MCLYDGTMKKEKQLTLPLYQKTKIPHEKEEESIVMQKVTKSSDKARLKKNINLKYVIVIKTTFNIYMKP